MIGWERLWCVPAFLGAFDFGFMVLAGPRVGAAVGAGSAYPWLFSAASFAYGAAVMPAAGRSLTAGFALAAAGTVLVAVAATLPLALAGRVLFGLGGGIAAPAALARIATRRTGFPALGAAVALGFAAGTLVAWLIPWRAALAGTALLVAAAAIAAARERAGESAPADRPWPAPRVPAGAVLSSGATVALAVALAGVPVALLVVAGLGAAAGRRAAPWLPVRRGAAAGALLGAAATTASGVGGMVVLGRSLAGGPAPGLVLAAFGVAALPAARAAGVLAARRGAAVAGGAGLGLQALGLAAAAATLGTPALAAALALFGAGHVIANAGAAGAAAALAGEHVAPVAGLLVTAQYVGGGVGSLLMTGVAARSGVAPALAAVAATGALALGASRG